MNAGTTRADGCSRRGVGSLPRASAAWMLSAAGIALAPFHSAQAQCEPEEIPGVNGPVYAMVNWDQDGAGPLPPVLVVGGSFTMAGNIEANNIAVWNPSTRRWSALGAGMAGSGELTAVHALAALPDGTLAAGGDFQTAGVVGAPWIARWNGAAWLPVGSVLDQPVRALAAMPNGDLVAGGDFWYVARWNGTAWSAVGNASTDGDTFALAVMPNGDLVAGGRFLHLGGVAASKIARWNGTVWSALGSGMNEFVTSLAPLPNGDLFAGGNFTSAGGQDAFFTARWNGSSWSPLGGLAGNVYALALLPNGHLVAGGNFVVAGSVSALRLARWDGANWSAMGAGANSTVYSLCAQPNGDVMAGGLFDSAGSQDAHHIARWDGSGWSALTGALVASDAAANDEFGISVAVSGDTVVVGSRLDDNATGTDAGAAYVYVKSGPGIEGWTQQAKLIGDTMFDLELNSQSGISVAISGDTAMVGSWLWPNANATGVAYVFVRSGPPGAEVWTQQAALQCPQFGSFQYFGYSLALEGDAAVVGTLLAPGLNVGGQAFFYLRSGPPGSEQWNSQQKFPSDGVPGDQFGNSVAMSPSQDSAVVGAWMEDNAGGTDAGSAYVFTRTGNSWVEQAKLTALDGAAGDLFGVKVAIAGDTAVVGAHSDNNAGGVDAGAVYIFTRTGTVWTQQAKLTASDAAAGDAFGVSLSLSGDLLVVGAHGRDSGGASNTGAAYVFRRSGPPGSEVWVEDRRLAASDPAAEDWFGVAIAVSGGTALIGARQDDHGGRINAGSVYPFGVKVCPADVNCDGFVDGIDADQFNNDFEAGNIAADYNGDGFVDGIDADMFNNDFEFGC